MNITYTQRYLGDYLLAHPDELDKMVFIAGPRQVGKTTLLQSIASLLGYEQIAYLNWDSAKDRPPIRDIHYTFFNEQVANAKNKPLIIFDELHKYPKWKSFLKGYFDTFHAQLATFVTGSARLDIYRRGGDSLLGRYWLLHLNPFSMNEVLGKMNPLPPDKFISDAIAGAKEVVESLLQFGGFPEPFLSASSTLHRRWCRLRRKRLIKEDLRDLSKIHDLTHIENLMDLVIASTGSTLSVNSLRESLNVSYNAVNTWLKWLEAIYYCFRISPYFKQVARGLKKEGKYYLFDWSEVLDPGARFENMVAMHLRKSVDFWNDTGIGDFDLRFVRDLEKREVDFLILRDKKPWMLIECKLQGDEIPASLLHIASSVNPQHIVLVTRQEQSGRYRVLSEKRIWVSGAASFLFHFL